MVVPVFILGRTNHHALKTIPLFSNNLYSLDRHKFAACDGKLSRICLTSAKNICFSRLCCKKSMKQALGHTTKYKQIWMRRSMNILLTQRKPCMNMMEYWLLGSFTELWWKCVTLCPSWDPGPILHLEYGIKNKSNAIFKSFLQHFCSPPQYNDRPIQYWECHQIEYFFVKNTQEALLDQNTIFRQCWFFFIQIH